MSRLLYYVALILVVIWALGYFLNIHIIPGLGTGKLLHSLLLLAVIAVVLRFLRFR